MTQKQLLIKGEHNLELDWLENNLFRQGGEGSVKVSFTDDTFEPNLYRGDFCLDRIDLVRSGKKRTLSKAEFSSCCYLQQSLELLFCLFLAYGDEFPEDITPEFGVSYSRLMSTPYAHYYGEWILAKRARDLLNCDRKNAIDLQKKYDEQMLKVKESEETAYILRKFRDLYPVVHCDLEKKWDPFVPTQVAGHCALSEFPVIVDVAVPYTSTSNSEGVRQDCLGLSTVHENLLPFAEFLKIDLKKRDDCFAVCTKSSTCVKHESTTVIAVSDRMPFLASKLGPQFKLIQYLVSPKYRSSRIDFTWIDAPTPDLLDVEKNLQVDLLEERFFGYSFVISRQSRVSPLTDDDMFIEAFAHILSKWSFDYSGNLLECKLEPSRLVSQIYGVFSRYTQSSEKTSLAILTPELHLLPSEVFFEFQKSNRSLMFPWLSTKKNRWNFTQEQKSQLYEYNTNIALCRANCEPIVDESEANYHYAVQCELENELALPDGSIVSTQTESNQYLMPWDIHRFGPLIDVHLAVSVSWNRTKLDLVERICVMDAHGHLILDYCVAQGLNYESSLYIGRRHLYMMIYGTNLYGFNVFQHLSRVGIVGDRSRIVDLCSLPCIRGAKPCCSNEKLQLRYGRSRDSVVADLDSMKSNLGFVVFLMHRDGIRWRYRRRSNH